MIRKTEQKANSYNDTKIIKIFNGDQLIAGKVIWGPESKLDDFFFPKLGIIVTTAYTPFAKLNGFPMEIGHLDLIKDVFKKLEAEAEKK